MSLKMECFRMPCMLLRSRPFVLCDFFQSHGIESRCLLSKFFHSIRRISFCAIKWCNHLLSTNTFSRTRFLLTLQISIKISKKKIIFETLSSDWNIFISFVRRTYTIVSIKMLPLVLGDPESVFRMGKKKTWNGAFEAMNFKSENWFCKGKTSQCVCMSDWCLVCFAKKRTLHTR